MRYSTLFSLLLLVLIDSMGYGLIFPILSPLIFESHWLLLPHTSLLIKDIIYTIVLSVFAIFMFFSTPFIGDLSDRYGRKPLLLYCLFGTMLSSFICGYGIYASSLFWLILGRCGAGLTAGAGAVAQAAMIDISEQNAKTRHFGLMSLAGSIGFAIGPIIGGYFSNPKMISWFNYWTPFALDGLLALFNMILLYFSYHPLQKKEQKKQQPILLSVWKPILLIYEAFLEKPIWQLCLVLVAFETAWALYFQYVSIFLLQYYHLNSIQLGNFMSFIAIMFAITFIGIIRILLKFMSESTIIYISLPIAELSLILHFLASSLFVYYLLAIPLAVAVGLIWTALLTLFSNVVIEERQGWSMGIANSVVSISWIFGSLLAGALDFLNPRSPFWIAAILVIFSFIMMNNIRRLKLVH